MGLTIRLFEVRHGDSILIEHEQAGKSSFVLVDCNSWIENGQPYNPAFEYLRSRGVSELAALVITHLHADHYFGVELLLELKVRKLVVPPFISGNDKIFNEMIARQKEKILQVIDRTSDEEVGAKALSLASLLNFICNNEEVVVEGVGPESVLTVPGGPEVTAHILLPLRRIKGILNERLRSREVEIHGFQDWNDASIVIRIEYYGTRILLTGDSTLSQWREHERMRRRDGIHNLDVSVLKAPHHGSDHNNSKALFDYLLGPDKANKAILVSANGQSHPGDKFFDLIRDCGLQPWCTGLARQCTNIEDLKPILALPAEARPFVVHYEIGQMFPPCQGDIVVSVGADGLEISNSTGIPCVYDDNNVVRRTVTGT